MSAEVFNLFGPDVLPIADAMDGMAQLSADMWEEVGPKLTCVEADWLVTLLRSCGLDAHAEFLAVSHVGGDVEGDAHYVEDEAERGRITGWENGS